MMQRSAARGKALLLRLLCIGLATVLVFAVQRVYSGAEGKKMTEVINVIKVRPVCVGRFLIDVPSDAEISYRSAFVSGWNISSDLEETDEAFAVRLKQKEAELTAAKNEKGQISLERTKTIATGDVSGKVFVYGREWLYHLENGKRIDSEVVGLQADVRTNHVSFNFSGKIFKDTDAPELQQLATQVRSRNEDDIPSEPGFCFERGFLVEPLTAKQGEGVTMFVTLKNHPDVSIALASYAGVAESNPLLERDAKGKETFSPEDRARFTRLRVGNRSVNGIIGQELIEKVAEHNGTTGHSFMWESLRNDKTSVFTPSLVFELSTGHGQSGEPVSSSLRDDAAIALWDRMLSSLRLRPTNNAAAPVVPGPGTAKLGSSAMAGSVCPQNGWWRCSDGDDRTGVSGGRLQYLRAGETVPQALLLPPATYWQKLRGEQPSFQSKIPSSWKLIDRRSVRRGKTSTLVARAGASQSPTPGMTVECHSDVIDQQARSPIGAELSSGAICFASGWWQCLEPGAFDSVRWFASGAVLPHATKPVSLTLLEKVKGVPDFVRVTAAWRLVRFADCETPASKQGGVTPGDSLNVPGKDDSAPSEET